jgi:hypothetical protein
LNLISNAGPISIIEVIELLQMGKGNAKIKTLLNLTQYNKGERTMARPQIFTDQQLRRLLDSGMTQERIAQTLGVAPSTISVRARLLARRAMLDNHGVPSPLIMSMGDTRAAVLENFHRVAEMADDMTLKPMDKIRVAREMRHQLDFTIRAIVPLHLAVGMEYFMYEVLRAMEEADPEMKKKVMERLQARDTATPEFSEDVTDWREALNGHGVEVAGS